MCIQQSLVVALILQDLKHNQLLQNIEALGFEDQGKYSLDLISVICEVMSVPDELRDKWIEVYVSYLDQAKETETLEQLAKRCYQDLVSVQ